MADDTITITDTSKTDTTKISESQAIPGEHDNAARAAGGTGRKKEIGGRDGPDPTRYGDWEKAGRCIDF